MANLKHPGYRVANALPPLPRLCWPRNGTSLRKKRTRISIAGVKMAPEAWRLLLCHQPPSAVRFGDHLPSAVPSVRSYAEQLLGRLQRAFSCAPNVASLFQVFGRRHKVGGTVDTIDASDGCNVSGAAGGTHGRFANMPGAGARLVQGWIECVSKYRRSFRTALR